MSIPSFDDFLSSLDENEMTEIINKNQEPQIVWCEGLSANEKAMFNLVYNKAVQQSLRVFLLYLHRYHEWLTEYI